MWVLAVNQKQVTIVTLMTIVTLVTIVTIVTRTTAAALFRPYFYDETAQGSTERGGNYHFWWKGDDILRARNVTEPLLFLRSPGHLTDITYSPDFLDPRGSHGPLLRLVRTVYIHRIWPYIWWFPCQKYRIYTAYIWFWPTLAIINIIAAGTGSVPDCLIRTPVSLHTRHGIAIWIWDHS